MARLEWIDGLGQTLDGWPMSYVLYAEQEVLRRATLLYQPHIGPKGMWIGKLHGWDNYIEIEEAQICAPPKEYMESLVLLSYDIGDKK